MGGFIYFIACEPLEAVKIGFTRGHPLRRLRELQTGCPSRLKLLDYVEGSEEEEKRLHRAFAPLSVHGEWFRHELKLRDFIYYLDHEPGVPANRQCFENALHDVLLVGCWYPFQPTPEHVYAASATAGPFEYLLSE